MQHLAEEKAKAEAKAKAAAEAKAKAAAAAPAKPGPDSRTCHRCTPPLFVPASSVDEILFDTWIKYCSIKLLTHQGFSGFVPDGLRPLLPRCFDGAHPARFRHAVRHHHGFRAQRHRPDPKPYGPNRVGIPVTKIRIFGFRQFIADGLKTLTKKDIVPRTADKMVHFLAPVVMPIPVCWPTRCCRLAAT